MTTLPTTMKFSCLVEKGKCEIRTRPLPELKADDVLLKVKACNICTVDYQQFMGLREKQGYPMAGGNELCGEIISKGDDVQGFEFGDLVAVGYVRCGHCEACMEGRVGECPDMRKESPDGYKFGEFGFADYTVKPARALFKLRKDLEPSQAAFVEPLSTVIDGLKNVRIAPYENVVVIGAGPMGLLNALTARSYGARVIVTELLDSKLTVAREMGFDVVDSKSCDPVEAVRELTGGKGADVVIGAVANGKAYDQGIEMLKKSNGRFLVFAAGYPAPEWSLTPNEIHYRKIQVFGAYGGENDSFRQAALALSQGFVDVSKLVEAKFHLDDMQEAYEAAVAGDYRISIVFDE